MSSPSSSNYPPINYQNSSAAVCFVFAFVATIAVPLRFWARKLTKVPLGLDDYLVLATLIVHHLFTGLAAATVFHGGMGSDFALVQAQGPDTIVFLFKV